MSEAMPGDKTADWLTGGGEMGELIRAFDWSATPVGAIASWSPSLRTTVSLLLASRYPMTLIWGRELIEFYNDGYMELLGSKHPSALGRPHQETFSEVLDTVGSMTQSVMTTGIPIWEPEQLLVLERNAQAYEQERKRAEALAALDRAKTTFFSNNHSRTPDTAHADARAARRHAHQP